MIAFPTEDVDPQAEAVNPRAVLLVVEIVSKSNPKNDLVTKLEDYPRMGVPLYVVVDPRNGTIAVHSEPKEGPDGLRYRCSVPYGFRRCRAGRAVDVRHVGARPLPVTGLLGADGRLTAVHASN